MTTRRRSERRLLPLATLTAAAATALVVFASSTVTAAQWQQYRYPTLGLAALTTVANLGLPRWPRNGWHGLTATSAVVIVGVVLAPPNWLVLAVLAGAVPARAALRRPPVGVTFAVAKDVLATGVAAYLASWMALRTPVADLGSSWPVLATAAAAFIVVDVILSVTALASVDRATLWRNLVANWDIRSLALLGNIVAATSALIAWRFDRLLIAALPLLILAFQLSCANRLRSRAEREAWRRLAQAMDEFNQTDLDTVRHAAARWAVEIFGAERAWVVLNPDLAPSGAGGAVPARQAVTAVATGTDGHPADPAGHPVSADRAAANPAATEPAATHPAASQRAAIRPAAIRPAAADRAGSEPSTAGRAGARERDRARGRGGDPARPTRNGERVLVATLDSYDGVQLGELHLVFHRRPALSQRERYALRTFTAALCTAVRNATTFARTTQLERERERAALRDALTGLANRRGLEELAAGPLSGAQTTRTALLLIDLNHFKEINEILGHGAGDRVLADVARRLREAARPDDIVCRMGGDEFAVLLCGLDKPALAVPRARALLACLSTPVVLDGTPIAVEASGGMARGAEGVDINELLRRADVAMYQAKQSGQQISVYARAHDTADVGRLRLGGELARAVSEREFTVNFQPIVDMCTGMVISTEALARWLHPDRGPLHPHRFLDSVERSGLLPAFARGVLDQSLRAAANWRQAGFDLPVAVNMSPRSLLDPAFPEIVHSCLAAREVPPDRLVIELTESVTLSHLEVVDEVLHRLRDLGVRLALDDFGTGYSSLGTVARIPVHELKIDREFVARMRTSLEAAAVVRSTIDLGRELGLLVVAEGVEDHEQRLALCDLGCPAGQGHLFGRPVPAHRMLVALRRGTGGRPGALAPALPERGSPAEG